jgi:hypothetical protein
MRARVPRATYCAASTDVRTGEGAYRSLVRDSGAPDLITIVTGCSIAPTDCDRGQ